jgi:DNA-binding GntR family transcriptional regulator
LAVLEYNSVVPLYEQVKESIRQEILHSGLKPRQKLLTEKEYVNKYEVSIITVRKAVSELVKEGLVEKKQGKGIFVSAPAYQKSFSSRVMSFTETCLANGLRPGARLLEADSIVPDPKILKRLGLPDGTMTVHLVRLRLAGDMPCVVEENFFPPDFSWLLKTDLTDKSLYRLLREDRGIDILPGPLTLKIIRADKATAELLQVPRNTPMLRTEGLLFRTSGEPLHVCFQKGYGEDFDIIVR